MIYAQTHSNNQITHTHTHIQYVLFNTVRASAMVFSVTKSSHAQSNSEWRINLISLLISHSMNASSFVCVQELCAHHQNSQSGFPFVEICFVQCH